jgi:hypothetical protein
MGAVKPFAINPPPGIVKGESLRLVEGRYIDSDMVRFWRGHAEKRGGWQKAVVTPTSGQPRAIHAWRDNNSNNFMGAGTYRKLYVYDSDWVQNDITPFRLSGTEVNNPFTTTNGSKLVSVSHTAHGVIEGDTIIFSGASTFNGINPNGTWIVLTVTNANAYVFQHTSTANASGAGGGAAVTYQYEVNVGVELGTYGLGWGTGGWGLGTWGTIHSSSTIFIEPRIWSLQNFGQILLSAYNGGTLYDFNPTVAKPWPRAQVVAAAPTDIRSHFITPERFVIALRANMVLHGSTQSDYTVWTPSSSNTAFSRTLQEGTKLVAGKVLGPFMSLIFSDSAAYLMQYTGSQFVYNISLAGKDCGLIAPNAAVTIDGVAYWMGRKDFWMYDGTIRRMPNTNDIRFVFDSLNDQALFQCHAVYNPDFDEIEFFYTELGSNFPTKSVIFSRDSSVWAPQLLRRVSGTHFTQGDTRPYMGSDDGFIYLHEVGYNGDGAAIAYRLQLAPYAMQEGQYHVDVSGISPDFKGQVGDVTLLIETYDHLQDTALEDSETETITVTTGMVDLHVSGRFISLKMSGNSLGCFMRMGKPVAWITQSGTRRP